MKTGRAIAAAAVVLIVLLTGVWRSGPSPLTSEAEPSIHPGTSSTVTLEIIEATVTDEFQVAADDDPLAGYVGEGLNRAGGTAAEDLQILDEVLAAWRTNFPSEGNPVGTNREITRALGGANVHRVEFIPSTHPAVNTAGELCDRWGTPLVFHQISGEQMELRSAGVDRRHYTDDDVMLSP